MQASSQFTRTKPYPPHTPLLLLSHLADAPHPATLLPYLCDVTRGGGPKTLRAPSRLNEGEGT
jgi:hypothetical protein